MTHCILFSNQDEGSVIVFGLDEKEGFSIAGVYGSQDLQKKVTEQCKQMEPTIRALFTICVISGKVIVSAEIPGVDISERPVFCKGVGRIKGSYVRAGESDEPMSEYEIYSYEAFRKRIRDDISTTGNFKMKCDFERLGSSRLWYSYGKCTKYVSKCIVTAWKLRIVVDYMEKFLSMLLEKCIRKPREHSLNDFTRGR